MQLMFYISLFVFWSMFWSFASVLIYRLHSWESGILDGRSHCNNCNHTLWFWDLIPIFSWLFNKGKCRYCKKEVSSIYPILEISTWILFTLIWYFLIDVNLLASFNLNEIIKLLFWLTIWFITILYTFYDIKYLEIHDWIMWVWIFISLLAIIFQSFWILNIIPALPIWTWIENQNIIFSIILLISAIIWFYIIMLKEFSDLIDSLIILLIIIWICSFKIYFPETNLSNYTSFNALIWALIIFIFFYIQYLIWVILHEIEKRTKKEKDYRFTDWIIWGWDLRIAILIGLLLWITLTPVWLMITYIVGSFLSIFILLIQKIKTKSQDLNTQVPFWPFLAIWFFITIFYQEQLSNLVKIYFL